MSMEGNNRYSSKAQMINSKKEEEDDQASTDGMLKVAAGIGLAAWGVSEIFGSVSEETKPTDDWKKKKAPGRKKEEEDYDASIGGILKVAAGIGIAAWVASQIFGSASEEAEPTDDRKKMKAPGRKGEIIFRDDFEEDPTTYFRGLRGDKGKK